MNSDRQGHPLAAALHALLPDCVAVHAADYDESGPADADLRAQQVLPRAIARAVPKRQAEYFAGRLCAQAALRALGYAAGGAIDKGALGAPVWPTGFVGSITHAGGIAAAAVARSPDAISIGIDVQPLLAPEQVPSLAPFFGTAAELEVLAQSVKDRVLASTLLFSAKEALYKCVAPLVGRLFDFADVESTPVGEGRLALRLRTDLGSGFAAGRVLEARFGVVLGTVLSTVFLPA